jgi:hypothetical protein
LPENSPITPPSIEPTPQSVPDSEEAEEANGAFPTPPPKRRRLIYKHLQGIGIPTGYITVAKALDEIGRLDFVTWGTQKAFRYMPIIKLKDGRRVQLATTVSPLGAVKNRMVEIDLPEGIDGPNSGELRRQFRSVRKSLKVALETYQVRARYHRSTHDFVELPAALCSSRVRSTLMLGITKNDRGRYCPIFIEELSFNAWLADRNRPQQDRVVSGSFRKTTRVRIAAAIDYTAKRVNFYPKSADLLDLLQEAAKTMGRPKVSMAEFKRIRGELTSVEFTTAGTRKSLSPDDLAIHRNEFIRAIQKELPN